MDLVSEHRSQSQFRNMRLVSSSFLHGAWMFFMTWPKGTHIRLTECDLASFVSNACHQEGLLYHMLPAHWHT